MSELDGSESQLTLEALAGEATSKELATNARANISLDRILMCSPPRMAGSQEGHPPREGRPDDSKRLRIGCFHAARRRSQATAPFDHFTPRGACNSHLDAASLGRVH